MKKVNLGIIGCGAVVQSYHLPASKFARNINILIIIDKNIQLAKKICQRYDIPYFSDDYHKIFNFVDGVLIALPNNLHALVSMDFLKRGIPVLCEKPIANNIEGCEDFIKNKSRICYPPYNWTNTSFL